MEPHSKSLKVNKTQETGKWQERSEHSSSAEGVLRPLPHGGRDTGTSATSRRKLRASKARIPDIKPLQSGRYTAFGVALFAVAALTLFRFAGAQEEGRTARAQLIGAPSASREVTVSKAANDAASEKATVGEETETPTAGSSERKTEESPTREAATGGNVSDVFYNLALVFGLTLLNGAFSMAETALVSLRRSRVEQLVEEGRRGANTVQQLLDDPPRFIATVQIGITLLGFASAAAAATTLSAPLVPLLDLIPGMTVGVSEGIAVTLVTFLTAIVSMVLGEIVPKSLALQAPDIWALRLAPFVNLCAVVFLPLTSFAVWLSNIIVAPFGGKAKFETPLITREEFEQIVDQGEKHGELDDEEAKIITNVFDLSETAVRAVMTPRIDMTALPVDAPLPRTLETILESGHSRIPVYEESIDNIVGIIHAKDLLPHFKAELNAVNLRDVMRRASFVPETKKVSELLAEMRRDKVHMAIVKDEYSGTAGLVTIEDLLEEIVGEIRDEYDVDEPELQVLSETESLIDARMGILDVNDRLGLDLPHDDYDTIGGLVFGLLGHEPVEGESVRQDGIQFQVERVQGHRIRTIRAVRYSEDSPDELAEAGAIGYIG